MNFNCRGVPSHPLPVDIPEGSGIILNSPASVILNFFKVQCISSAFGLQVCMLAQPEEYDPLKMVNRFGSNQLELVFICIIDTVQNDSGISDSPQRGRGDHRR